MQTSAFCMIWYRLLNAIIRISFVINCNFDSIFKNCGHIPLSFVSRFSMFESCSTFPFLNVNNFSITLYWYSNSLLHTGDSYADIPINIEINANNTKCWYIIVKISTTSRSNEEYVCIKTKNIYLYGKASQSWRWL